MTTDYCAAFDIPRDICYLNACYMGPQPRAVLAASQAGATRRSQPWTIAANDFFDDVETLRRLFAAQVQCAPDNIAIVPSAGYGVACAAANLPVGEGGVILAMHEQFPSNYYAWTRYAESAGAEFQTVEKGDDETWADAFLAAIDALGHRITIATLEGHHWATAETIDLERIIPSLREVGARVVLDLTQSIGASPANIASLAPDFMVSAAYKWQFCPYGISFLYVADEFFDGVSIEEPWMSRDGAEDFSRLSDFTDRYQAGARRYDMSQKSSFSNVAGAIAALTQIAEWGIDNIRTRLVATNRQIAAMLAGHGLDVIDEDLRAPHFQSARLPDADPRRLAERLIERGVYASVRGNNLRVAPHVYTDAVDIARFDTALGSALKSAQA